MYTFDNIETTQSNGTLNSRTFIYFHFEILGLENYKKFLPFGFLTLAEHCFAFVTLRRPGGADRPGCQRHPHPHHHQHCHPDHHHQQHCHQHHLKPIISPASKLHDASLLVKGKILNVHLTGGVVDGRRLPLIMMIIFDRMSYSFFFFTVFTVFSFYIVFFIFVFPFALSKSYLHQSIVKKGGFCCQRHFKVAVSTEKDHQPLKEISKRHQIDIKDISKKY